MKKKKPKNLVLPPRRALFGHPVQIFLFFFALIKQIVLKTLVEIIFRDHTIFFRVLGPPYNQNEEQSKFYIWSVLK